MESSQIESLRSQLPKEVDAACDDETIQRFINATRGDLDLALQRLKTTTAWRLKVRPESLECKSCLEDACSHYMHIVGFCRIQRPVFYTCMQLSHNKDVEAGKTHMISRFEQAIRIMPKGVQEWIWFSDFYGFGVADLNPSMARIFIDLLGTHYPERLGVYFLVDTPRIFQMLWRVVKPWVDPATAEKLVFLTYTPENGNKPSKMYTKLQNYFDDDLIDWIVEEMRQNRDPEARKGKGFDVRAAYKDAIEGKLVMEKPHDFRGTNKIFERYTQDPSLLLPVGQPQKGEFGTH